MTTSLEARLEIELVGLSLPKGSTTNDSKCPWCGFDKSFSVTHTWQGDILYKCHRASCPKAGRIKGRGNSTPTPERRVFNPRVFDLATQRVGDKWESYLLGAYGVTREEIDWAGWRYSPEGNRLCMPVLSPYGAHRGWTTKRLPGGEGLKSDTFREVDDVWMGWYQRQREYPKDKEDQYPTVILVEDLISALVASRYHPAVALLGVGLGEDKVDEVLEVSKNVTICLDRDATDRAFDLVERYSLFGNFIVVPLSKDIKDMNKEELEEWNVRVTRSS